MIMEVGSFSDIRFEFVIRPFRKAIYRQTPAKTVVDLFEIIGDSKTKLK